MLKTLRNLLVALAMVAGVQTAMADDFDFVGIYSFASTATVVDEIAGWGAQMPGEFDFSISLNSGDDASAFPYIVKGFLPRTNVEQAEPNVLKAKRGADGETLVIIAGDVTNIYDGTPHICAYNGAGKDGGVGELVMTKTGASTFTFADGITATWHQVIDLGIYQEDKARDMVKYTDITVTKAVEEAIDFLGSYRMLCQNNPVDDRLTQVSWMKTDNIFDVLPNDQGQFDESFDYVVCGFMSVDHEFAEGPNAGRNFNDLPAYRSTDGKSLVIVAGEDHLLAEGGTHFCAWTGHDGNATGSPLLVMTAVGDGTYTFVDDLSWIYHNKFSIGPMEIDEPHVLSYLTDITVTPYADCLGTYSFHSTTEEINEMTYSKWDHPNFDFTVTLNTGDDAAHYPFLIDGFLPYGDYEVMGDPHTLKGYAKDGNLVIAAGCGDGHYIYGGAANSSRHICAFDNEGYECGNGDLVMAPTVDDATYTFPAGIVVVSHSKFDWGIPGWSDDTPTDIVRYTEIVINRSLTGINEVTIDAPAAPTSLPVRYQGTYSLDGRRVSGATRPGFYIHNGRKVIR